MPELIPNGGVFVNFKTDKRKLIVGTKFTFKCNNGYKLTSNVSQYVCQQNGKWNSQVLNPKCSKG